MVLSGWMELVAGALPLMLKGAGWTLVLAVASVVFGALVGALVALVRLAKIPLLATLAALYVSGFRGTPLLVQLFVIYFGLPSIGIQFDPITAGILGLSLNVTIFQPFPLYLTAAAIYWALSASFESLQKKLERRLNRGYLR